VITGIDWMKMYVLLVFHSAVPCDFNRRLIALVGREGGREREGRAHTRWAARRRLKGRGGNCRQVEGWSMKNILTFGSSSGEVGLRRVHGVVDVTVGLVIL
jgi:hypothetical protein